ncbi:MAG: hypothetical protein ACI83N_001720 [Hydrogenophaga sp.]
MVDTGAAIGVVADVGGQRVFGAGLHDQAGFQQHLRGGAFAQRTGQRQPQRCLSNFLSAAAQQAI